MGFEQEGGGDSPGTYQPLSEKDASNGYVGLTLLKINFKNALNTFTSYFTNSNTASRTYTFQNRDGTIADLTDLAGYLPTTTSLLICSYKVGWASGYAPADSATVYFGDTPTGTPNGTATNRQFRLPLGVLRSAVFSVAVATTPGTTETVTFNLRNITDGSSDLIYATLTMDVTTRGFVATGLSIPTDSSKEYAIEMVTPAWATNPTGVTLSMTLNIFDQQ